MTEIPIDPALREAVIKELQHIALNGGGSIEQIAESIIRAINRVQYLQSVQAVAKRYAELSLKPDRKPAQALPIADCCCRFVEGDTTNYPTYVCKRCEVHQVFVPTTRLMCYEHRKEELEKKQ